MATKTTAKYVCDLCGGKHFGLQFYTSMQTQSVYSYFLCDDCGANIRETDEQKTAKWWADAKACGGVLVGTTRDGKYDVWVPVSEWQEKTGNLFIEDWPTPDEWVAWILSTGDGTSYQGLIIHHGVQPDYVETVFYGALTNTHDDAQRSMLESIRQSTEGFDIEYKLRDATTGDGDWGNQVWEVAVEGRSVVAFETVLLSHGCVDLFDMEGFAVAGQDRNESTDRL